jgi:hypothetical protein
VFPGLLLSFSSVPAGGTVFVDDASVTHGITAAQIFEKLGACAIQDINATFTPQVSGMTLAEAAAALGLTGFDWVQTVTVSVVRNDRS